MTKGKPAIAQMECGEAGKSSISRSGQRVANRLYQSPRMPGSIAILYATVSGNTEVLARLAAERLQASGRDVAVHNVAEFSAGRLREFETALIIASTWGEGEPPPDAVEFCAALQQHEVLRLPKLRFAVFALGSSSYKDFCGCGRRIDENLEKSGATRLLPRAESDTKFKTAFANWLKQVEAVL
jgi:sulfite reductase (NADPH) flavoprotein alpha-component